jgi:hypothetical protein
MWAMIISQWRLSGCKKRNVIEENVEADHGRANYLQGGKNGRDGEMVLFLEKVIRESLKIEST